jgi:hypothetical protein
LIEEEKFRKTGKKKFEQITEKVLSQYTKLNALVAETHNNSNNNNNNINNGIEIKMDFSNLSSQSKVLLKGKAKERSELMHLELIPNTKNINNNTSKTASSLIPSLSPKAKIHKTTTTVTNENTKSAFHNILSENPFQSLKSSNTQSQI